MTLSSVKILVVDDHHPTLRQWQSMLQDRQFEVVIADHGQAAYQLACDHVPDVILSDIDMPEVNGFQLLTLLKETPITAAIPVVVCSSTTDQTSKLLALKLGATAYLQKPLNISDLINIVAEHCLPTSMSA